LPALGANVISYVDLYMALS